MAAGVPLEEETGADGHETGGGCSGKWAARLWPRPRKCGSNKLGGISQAREISPFYKFLQKEKSESRRDYVEKKTPTIFINKQKLYKDIYLNKLLYKIGVQYYHVFLLLK